MTVLRLAKGYAKAESHHPVLGHGWLVELAGGLVDDHGADVSCIAQVVDASVKCYQSLIPGPALAERQVENAASVSGRGFIVEIVYKNAPSLLPFQRHPGTQRSFSFRCRSLAGPCYFCEG